MGSISVTHTRALCEARASAEPLLAQSVAEVRGDSSPVLLAKLKHGLAQVRHRQGRVEEGFELADEAELLADWRVPAETEMRKAG